ncbi:MAG: cobalamin-dependent protein, partial [Phycisphaerales bacterium]
MTEKQNITNENKALKAYAASLRERFGPGKRLLLVQAPQFLFETINPEVIRSRGYYAYQPTGLQRLAESLSERDIEVKILDLNLHILRRIAEQGRFDPERWLDALDEQLDTFQPNMVGVTCLTVYTDLFATNHPLTSILRHLAGRGEQMVVIGGPTATNEMDRYLQEGLCHFAIEGEGEDRLSY